MEIILQPIQKPVNSVKCGQRAGIDKCGGNGLILDELNIEINGALSGRMN